MCDHRVVRLRFAFLLAGLANACGGNVAPTTVGAPDAAATPAPAPASDASADVSPCVAPAIPDPIPGPGECSMPSGRICAGSCTCDDGCNRCMCLPGGGVSQTDIACPMPPTTPTTCAEGSVTASCRAVPVYTRACAGLAMTHAYYCSASVLATCGANACPSPGCTLDDRDGVGGAYWCCP